MSATAMREIKTFPGKPSTLVQVLQYAQEKHGKKAAFHYKQAGKWTSVSYQDVAQRIRYVALGLNKIGINHGDRVSVMAESCVDWIVADFGSLSTGAADVPIYPTLTPKQAAYIIKDSGSQVIFVSDEKQLKKVLEVIDELPQLKKIVVFEKFNPSLAKTPGLVMQLKELEEIGQTHDKDQPKLYEQITSKIQAKDLATLIYTSGTTGEPKGVILTHWNLTFNVVNTADESLDFTDEDCSLSFLPFSHVFERAVVYSLIYMGDRKSVV